MYTSKRGPEEPVYSPPPRRNQIEAMLQPDL
jgi:hypothetical protein